MDTSILEGLGFFFSEEIDMNCINSFIIKEIPGCCLFCEYLGWIESAPVMISLIPSKFAVLATFVHFSCQCREHFFAMFMTSYFNYF